MVGQLANQVDGTFGKERKCSSNNSLSSLRAQNRDLRAALQMSLTKVTRCTLSKAKYENEKGSQLLLL